MITEVIDSNMERIESDLLGQGLSYERLREDILDHVCCMVEELMIEGKDFETSYRQTIDSIGEGTLKGLQHQTLLLLDRKFQRMKNTAYIIGLSGSILTLIGALFKMMHWPGASILILAGFLLVTAIFLPLYFIYSYRELTEKPKLIYPVVGYLTIALILVGAIFKIQHWPGANILLKLSLGMVIIGFVPLFLSQLFKKTQHKKANIAYVILLLIGISIITVLSRVNISKYAIDRLRESTYVYMESMDLLDKSTAEIVAAVPDSIMIPEAGKVMDYSDRLRELSDQMIKGMMSTIGDPETAFKDIHYWDYRRGAKRGFIDNGLADKFLSLAREYKDYLLSVTPDPVAKDQIGIEMQFSVDQWYVGWTPEDYIMEPFIICYEKIKEMERAVVYSEYLAVKSLLN